MTFSLAGDGSVFETVNNGKSVYMARVTLRDDSSGRSVVVSGTGSTRKQAVERRDKNVQRRLAKLDPDLTAVQVPQVKTRLRARKQGMRISEYEAQWHSVTGNRTKPQTKAKHSQRLAQWVYPWLDQPMSELTKTKIEVHLYSTLPAQGAGPTSIYDAFCSLKALLSSAYEHEVIKSNPAATVRMQKPTPQVKQDDERLIGKRLKIFQYLVREVAEQSHPHHEHYPLLLLMSVGLRRSELLGLDWSSVKLPKKGPMTLIIEQQLIRSDEGYSIQKSTKTSKVRTLTLPASYKQAFIEKQARDGKAEGLVFTKRNGEPLNYSAFNRLWHKILKSYLTKDGRELREDDLFRPHFTRKIAATMLAQRGVSVKVAAQILGHDPTVLLKTYHNTTREDMQQGTEALASGFMD